MKLHIHREIPINENPYYLVVLAFLLFLMILIPRLQIVYRDFEVEKLNSLNTAILKHNNEVSKKQKNKAYSVKENKDFSHKGTLSLNYGYISAERENIKKIILNEKLVVDDYVFEWGGNYPGALIKIALKSHPSCHIIYRTPYKKNKPILFELKSYC